MCSRFEINARPRDLAGRFGLDAPPPAVNAADLRPTDQALVIDRLGDDRGASAGLRVRLLGWGLAVDWTSGPLINARAETLAEKPTFRPLLDARCLVPASAYFEWRKSGPARHKNRIQPAAGDIFAFAGLTDGERFTIVTCAPAPAIAHIHERMPVILDRRAEPRWIDPAQSFEDVAGLLVPYAVGELTADEEPPSAAPQPDLFG